MATMPGRIAAEEIAAERENRRTRNDENLREANRLRCNWIAGAGERKPEELVSCAPVATFP